MDAPINVIGLSSLINKNETNRQLDIKDIESEFINKNSIFNSSNQNIQDEYLSIEDYQCKLQNINANISTHSDQVSNYKEDDVFSVTNLPNNKAYSFNGDDDNMFMDDNDDAMSVITQMNDLDKDLNELNFNMSSASPPKSDPLLVKMTNEQHNQNIVNNALGDEYDNSNINFDIDQESKDEKKLMLLEKIGDIHSKLMDEGIDVNNIPPVDHTSNIESIEYSHRVYMIKYNRHRFSGFAEEFILAGAGVLETVFNGNNKFLGLKPDLTDYSDTVRVKLRRLRHETSTIMGGVMEQYSIGPVMRIMIELLPSMFLHAKMNKSQYKNNIHHEMNMNNAISDLRNLET